MKKKNKSWVWIVVTLVVIGALVALLVFEGKKPGKYDSFAECITNSGAKFYGAWWCPHCAAEKALFGKSVDKLPYVECQTPQQQQNALCNSIGITEYPTWIFKGGTKVVGVQTFAQLAAQTGCIAPTN